MIDQETVTDRVVARLRARLPAVLADVDPTLEVPPSDRIYPGVIAMEADLPAIEVVAPDADYDRLDVDVMYADARGLVFVQTHLTHPDEDREAMYRAAHRYNRAVIGSLAGRHALPELVVSRCRATVQMGVDGSRSVPTLVTAALVAVELAWTTDIVEGG